MFFSKDHNKLYLSTVKLNIARVFTMLATTINENGGRVKETTPGFIIDRTVYDKMIDLKEQIARIENAVKEDDARKDILLKVLDADKKQLCDLEKTEKEITPTPATHINYISFVLDDVYYYISIDDNIFGDATIIKAPVTNNKRSRNLYGEKFTKKWLINDLFNACDDETIKNAVLMILEEAKKATYNKPYIESYKKRVSNTYNNSYHYETVYKKEEFVSLDF